MRTYQPLVEGRQIFAPKKAMQFEELAFALEDPYV
jgi:hypothetical protein